MGVEVDTMRQPDFAMAELPSLPHDLVDSHIIPDILSEHLHLFLVSPVAPSWNAFYTLPLVSYSFRRSCYSLYTMMFGLEQGEDLSAIADSLSFAQSLWNEAKRSPKAACPVLEYTHDQLMGGNISLIRIYMCIALARSFLNYDVLRYITPPDRNWHFEDLEQGFMGVTETSNNVRVEHVKRYRIPDETMHRLFLPLTCAMKLCDAIRPQRLAFLVAEYLADIVPLLSTTPVMLKYSQDLRSYIAREHRVEEETWVKWMHQTLGLIEDTGILIEEMQGTGRLVQSFSRTSSIPYQVLQITDIVHILEEVLRGDWGLYSEGIQARACSLLREWTVSVNTCE